MTAGTEDAPAMFPSTNNIAGVPMNAIIYLVGLVVIVLAIINLLGG